MIGNDAAAMGRFVEELVVPHPDARGADELGGDMADLRAEDGRGEGRVGLPGVVDLDEVNRLAAQRGDVGRGALVVLAGDDAVGGGVDGGDLGVGENLSVDVIPALVKERDFLGGEGGRGERGGRGFH